MHEFVRSEICNEDDINKELTCNYILSIQLSDEWFSYCVLDKSQDKYIAISSYSLLEKDSKKQEKSEKSSIVQELVAKFEWLKNPFKEVCVIFVNKRATLIPSLLFDPTKKDEYLEFLHGKPEKMDFYHDYLKGLNIYNVYGLPSGIEKELKSNFANCKILHHSSTLLMNVYARFYDKGIKTQLFLNVQNDLSDIVIFKDGKFEYFNSFRFSSDEDLLYYLFYVIDKLTLNINDLSLLIMGEIEEGSKAYTGIRKYIKDVVFVQRNGDFKYIDVFDDIPPHYFYNLLNAHLCV